MWALSTKARVTRASLTPSPVNTAVAADFNAWKSRSYSYGLAIETRIITRPPSVRGLQRWHGAGAAMRSRRLWRRRGTDRPLRGGGRRYATAAALPARGPGDRGSRTVRPSDCG